MLISIGPILILFVFPFRLPGLELPKSRQIVSNGDAIRAHLLRPSAGNEIPDAEPDRTTTNNGSVFAKIGKAATDAASMLSLKKKTAFDRPQVVYREGK
jgi:hypothetical protein